MAANNYQFVQTRNLFCEYLTGYSENLTYEEWVQAEEDSKAALLYIRFYQEVTLAWYNAVISFNIVYVTQEDGVSQVLQYLMKNVSKINADKKRYTSNYIYRVCYNCLFDLWLTRKTDNQRSVSELSNEYVDGDTVVDLFDLVPSEDDDIETQKTKEAVWAIIRHMGPKAEKVVNHLINPMDTLHKVSESSSERPIDRLADVSVSKKEYEEIISELRVQLAPFKNILLHF